MADNRREMPGWLVTLIVILVGAPLGFVVFSAVKGFVSGSSRPSHTRKAQCLSNLRGFGNSLKIYASYNNDRFPAVERGPGGEVDSEASLWLLVETYVATPDSFICPRDRAEFNVTAFDDDLTLPSGAAVEPFPQVNAAGRVDPAGRYRTLSYSYQIANADYGDPGRDSPRATRFAIMADRAPPMDRMLRPPGWVRDAASARSWLDGLGEADRVRVNSPNHGGAGQNVLFQDGHAQWCADPWVGVDGDHIYTWGSYAATTRADRDDFVARNGTPEERIVGELPAVAGPITRGPAGDEDSTLCNIHRGRARLGP